MQAARDGVDGLGNLALSLSRILCLGVAMHEENIAWEQRACGESTIGKSLGWIAKRTKIGKLQSKTSPTWSVVSVEYPLDRREKDSVARAVGEECESERVH